MNSLDNDWAGLIAGALSKEKEEMLMRLLDMELPLCRRCGLYIKGEIDQNLMPEEYFCFCEEAKQEGERQRKGIDDATSSEFDALFGRKSGKDDYYSDRNAELTPIRAIEEAIVEDDIGIAASTANPNRKVRYKTGNMNYWRGSYWSNMYTSFRDTSIMEMRGKFE